MMRPDEVTLRRAASRAAGYRTGLFGKWHLGDNYPLRPEDQGFQETLVLSGGGHRPAVRPARAASRVLRPGPPAQRQGGEDEGLLHRRVHRRGDRLHRRRRRQAVLRLPRVQLPRTRRSRCRRRIVDAVREARPRRRTRFPKVGQPWAAPKLEHGRDRPRLRRWSTNIDDELRPAAASARRREARRQHDRDLPDRQRPGGVRFNAGLRDRKGTVYEGGIRVPCFVRWPAAAHGRARRSTHRRPTST